MITANKEAIEHREPSGQVLVITFTVTIMTRSTLRF
jgi:hypothetical protein